MLKIEGLKYRDILVHKETGTEHEVIGFDSNGKEIIFSSGEVANDLKYFKKKEQSQQCTFEEIVSEARTALDKGLLKSLYQADRTLSCVSVKGDNTILVQSGIIQSDAFDFIQSLYKETFMIECEDDIKRIKKGAEITLLNGNKSKVKRVDDDSTLEVEGWDYFLQFFSLKGAKVEQSKG